MCSLCGMLGGVEHWTDAASNPDSFGNRARTHTWHRERQDRVRLINIIIQHFGLTVSDWSGSSYLVRSQTGKTMIVDNLSQIWDAAETITGKLCDPLDDGLVARLSDKGRVP